MNNRRIAALSIAFAVCVVIPSHRAAATAKLGEVRSAPAGAATRHSVFNKDHALLYVSDEQGNAVYVFDLSQAGSPRIAKITAHLASPSMLAVDTAGTLYVVNTHTVTAYRFDELKPSLDLRDGSMQPSSVAVAPDGTVYVGGCCLPSRIDVFAAGQTVPSRVITDPLIGIPSQMVFDTAGDLYVADVRTGVYVLPAGSDKPQRVDIVLNTAAVGIGLDERLQRLYVVNDDDGVRSVNAYRLGESHWLYKLEPPKYAQALALDKRRDARVFVTSAADPSEVVVYPARGRQPIATIRVPGFSYGIAYKPPHVGF